MEKKRDLLIDALKGYACFLVVFGHVIMGIRKNTESVPLFFGFLEDFIWTFHVPLFMFLSGYVYRLTGQWKSKKTRIRFIVYKALNLGIPYIVFSVIYIVINSILSSSVNNVSSLSDILWLWRAPVAQFWFLYDLFFLFIAFTSLSYVLKNWQITIILFLIKVLLSFINVNLPRPLSSMIDYALLFGIGSSIEKLYIDKLRYRFLFVMLHIFITGLIIQHSTSYINLNNVLTVNLIRLLGCVGSIAFISLLMKIESIHKWFLFINKYSFPIYLLHTIFTSGIRIVLIKLSVLNYAVHVFLGLLLGIGVPVIIAVISERVCFFNICFYPSRTFKLLKESRKNAND